MACRILRGATLWLRNNVQRSVFTCTLALHQHSCHHLPCIRYFCASPLSSDDLYEHKFGMRVIDSTSKPNVLYSSIAAAAGSALGSHITLRGRISTIRKKGKMTFICLRSSRNETIQCIHFAKSTSAASVQFLAFLGSLTEESIIDVTGSLASASVKSCSVSDREIVLRDVFVVSAAPAQLPFHLKDAARSEEEIAESKRTDRPYASSAQQEIRLNNRHLDLRVPSNNAIMRLKSAVSQLFREYLYSQAFVEINSPKLIAGQSEGGSEVFRLDYFGQKACLAQSPQLYKQMAIAGDLERVFEIGPVFRAEPSKTRRHLCEFVGMDLEMAITHHYHETLHVLHSMFRYIFTNLECRFAEELAVVRRQYPSEPPAITSEPLILHWEEAIRMLHDAGKQVDPLADLSTPDEQLLGSLVKDKFHSDIFILEQPFYTMANPKNPVYSNSYDMFIRGQEIASGAQRCHDVTALISQVRQRGIDENSLQYYIDAFRYGIHPHAGSGIGLERVVFLYLGLDNIRKASMFPRDPSRCVP